MHQRTHMLTIALIVALATLVPSGVDPLALGGPSQHDIKVSESRGVRIVTTDDDGGPHEEVIEWFGGSGAFLGVRLGHDPDDRGGARIDGVIDGTAAEEAGLRKGDVIVAIDGHDVDTAADLTRRIHDLEPGDRVDVEVLRDGRLQTLSVELGEREGRARSFNFEGFERLGERMGELGERLGRGFAFQFDGDEGFDAEGFEEQMRELGERLGEMNFDLDIPGYDGQHRFHFGGTRPRLGVQLVATTPELREHLGGSDDGGVLVSKVLPNMPAEAAGVRVGDLIVAVDDEPVKTAGELIQALSGRSGKTIELQLIREGRELRLDVQLEEENAEPAGDRA